MKRGTPEWLDFQNRLADYEAARAERLRQERREAAERKLELERKMNDPATPELERKQACIVYYMCHVGPPATLQTPAGPVLNRKGRDGFPLDEGEL